MMPVCNSLSSTKKSNGFSIDNIIKTNDNSSNLFNCTVATSNLIPMAWLPTSANLYQLQRQSMIEYIRQTNQLLNSGITNALYLNSYRKPKRYRTAFTPSQLLKLEDAFEKNHYIVGQERKDLAKHLNLPESKVKIWYQNRRTKHKRSINDNDSNSSTNVFDKSDTTIKTNEDSQ